MKKALSAVAVAAIVMFASAEAQANTYLYNLYMPAITKCGDSYQAYVTTIVKSVVPTINAVKTYNPAAAGQIADAYCNVLKSVANSKKSVALTYTKLLVQYCPAQASSIWAAYYETADRIDLLAERACNALKQTAMPTMPTALAR